MFEERYVDQNITNRNKTANSFYSETNSLAIAALARNIIATYVKQRDVFLNNSII